MQHWIEDSSDEGRTQIVASSPPPVGWLAAVPRHRWAAPAAVAVLALAGFVAWTSWRAPSQVALAVPVDTLDAARGALARAGIRCDRRDGALWVEAADASRAAAAVAPRGEVNAVAAALEDESVFATGEASRSRRLAATIRTLESTIAMQPGVARASVVLGDAPRSFAPGSPSATSASVTVSMRSGPMPQDLVDAVGVLVAGACPGLRPEAVSVVDAGAGRVRAVRGAEERAALEASRRREDRAQAVVAAALGDIPGARVRITEGDSGALVASVELPQGYVTARAGELHGGSVVSFLEEERARIVDRIEPLIAHASACAVSVTVAADPGWEQVSVDAPEEAYSGEAPAARASADPGARERTLPLGAADRGSAPYGWIAGLLGLAAVAAWWTWRPARPGPKAAATAEEMPAFDEVPMPGADASDAVRASPERSAAVVRGWLERGDVGQAAHLVVALDADAAASVLRALPVVQVQELTGALGALDGPSHGELADAVDAFVTELGSEPGQAPASGCLVAEEAA